MGELIVELEKYLKENINKLNECECLKKHSGYEKSLCNKLTKFTLDTNRYYDVVFKDKLKIEIKKGKSIWLDLIRYGEILLGEGEKNTITLFFIPNKNKNKFEKILLVKTADLIKKLELKKEDYKKLLEVKSLVPRSLNAQASLTVKDIEEIAEIIKNETT